MFFRGGTLLKAGQRSYGPANRGAHSRQTLKRSSQGCEDLVGTAGGEGTALLQIEGLQGISAYGGRKVNAGEEG